MSCEGAPSLPFSATPPFTPPLPRQIRAMNIGYRKILTAAFVLDTMLLGAAFLPRFQRSPALAASLIGAAVLCGVWLAIIGLRGRGKDEPHSGHVMIRSPHWVQIIMHSLIYGYWGYYVPQVPDYVPLLLSQVGLAYLLDIGFAWSRGRSYQIGFGPIPIIFSTNLFLWFKDDWYYLQYAMVLVIFLAREFLRWERKGRNVHIINPSAAGLFVLSIGVIATFNTGVTWGEDIAFTLGRGPYMYEVIFVCGLVVQILFGVVLPTAAAVLTCVGLEALYFAATGDYFFLHTAIPVSVFLGMNLLVTDPVTSPTNSFGKVVFGMLYGILVFPLFLMLAALQTPTFYDKLLQVPVINAMAKWLDRLGDAITGMMPDFKLTAGRANLVHVGVWAIAFFAVLPRLKAHPGSFPETWMPGCESGDIDDCQRLHFLVGSKCNHFDAAECVRAGDLWADRRLTMQWVPEASDDEQSSERGRQMADMYGRACDMKNPDGCYALGMMFKKGDGTTVNYQRAGQLFDWACTAGHTGACRALTTVAAFDAKAGGDAADELVALDRDCEERDDWGACTRLGMMLHGPGDAASAEVDRARELFRKACNGGHAEACHNLGTSYLHGDAAPDDRQTGQRYHERACKLDHSGSCLRLAMEHLSGALLERDLARSIDYMQRACDLGIEPACEQVQLMRTTEAPPDGEEAMKARQLELLKRCNEMDIGACMSLQQLNNSRGSPAANPGRPQFPMIPPIEMNPKPPAP